MALYSITLNDIPSKKNGFTILELIITMIILSTLTIVVVSSFINLGHDAQINSTNTIAANLSSANSDNYAIRIINNSNGIQIKNCSNAANLLTGGLPDGYSIKSASVKVNVTKSCTLEGPFSTSATFTLTGIK